MLQQHPGLYFAPSGKHRYGMYCTEDIAAGSVIEICPIIIIPADQAREIVRSHILYEYYFEWKKDSIAVALGYGSLYNHAENPNAEFQPDYKISTSFLRPTGIFLPELKSWWIIMPVIRMKRFGLM